MELIGLVLFYLVLAVALALIPLSFPGTWLMFAATAAYAALGSLHPTGSDWIPLIVVALLAGLGELIELGIRIVGSRLASVPNGAIVAAIIGGVIGVFVGVPIFLIGSLVGLLIGIFTGAFAYGLVTKNSVTRSLAMAVATTFSQIVALFAKTTLGIGIIFYLSTLIF